jgi:pimeloyl-ACP methyl ester carboxylesterase
LRQAGFETLTMDLGDATVAVDIRLSAGQPGIVFVPGWCCPRTDWSPIADHLAEFTSVALDLPVAGGQRPGDGDRGAGLVDAGVLRPVIAAEMSLTGAQEAHRLSESGRTRGKIILRGAA